MTVFLVGTGVAWVMMMMEDHQVMVVSVLLGMVLVFK